MLNSEPKDSGRRKELYPSGRVPENIKIRKTGRGSFWESKFHKMKGEMGSKKKKLK